MSDQSQGPGWWLASDGKWYAPQPQQPPPAPAPPLQQPPPAQPDAGWGQPPQQPAPGPMPTMPNQPVPGPPPGPQVPPPGYAPTEQIPVTAPPAGDPNQWGYQTAPGGMPPGGMPPGGMPPGGMAPGGPPPAKGGKTGLLIGIAILAILLIGGGVAFAVTRPKADIVAPVSIPPTASTASTAVTTETTAAKKGTTTTEEETTTSKKKNPSTSKLSPSTTASSKSSTTDIAAGNVKAFCSDYNQVNTAIQAIPTGNADSFKVAMAALVATYDAQLTAMIVDAPVSIVVDVGIVVIDLRTSVFDPSVLKTPEWGASSKVVDDFARANC